MNQTFTTPPNVLFPLLENKTIKTVSKEDLERQKELAELNRLYSRVTDTEGFSVREQKALAVFYNDLAPGEDGKISINRVHKFLEETVKPKSPNMYQKIIRYYEIEESHNLPFKKLEKLSSQVHSYIDSLRTLENAMKYSIAFEEAAHKLAPKLDAPDDMSLLDRVKWLRIWIIVLRDQECFWGDMDAHGKFIGIANSKKFNNYYVYPESMITVEKEYFSALADGEIIYEMMYNFISLYPERIQKAVYRFGELDGLNYPDSNKIERIRLDIKKKLFYNSWRSSNDYFMTREGIKHFAHENLEMALIAYKNGGISTMPTFKSKICDICNDFKAITITCYKYGEIQLNGKTTTVGVTCHEELMLYVLVYEWLSAHPDFKFGVEEKTLTEYGFDTLLFDPKNAVISWILESGYATREEDINWSLVNEVLHPNENTDLFNSYYTGEISSDDVFNSIGFNKENLARMVCSFTGLSLLEKTVLEQALKRIKMFGLEHSLQSDQIYFKLYKYLLETKIPCGRKKQPISTFGIRYTF